MARKKGEPPSYEFVKDLSSTPVVVPPTPSMAGTHLVSALGPMVSQPQLDPRLTEEEMALIKELTGRPYVRFVWD